MPKGVYQHYSGELSPHFGKNHSEETKLKISIANKGKSPWHAGKHWSDEVKRKMSLSHLGEVFTEERIKKILRRRIPTSLEQTAIDIITENHLPFVFVGNGSFLVGRKNPDFIHETKRIAIDVFYTYFKNIDGRNVDDWKTQRENYFKERGWDLLFFDETQVSSSLEALKELI